MLVAGANGERLKWREMVEVECEDEDVGVVEARIVSSSEIANAGDPAIRAGATRSGCPKEELTIN